MYATKKFWTIPVVLERLVLFLDPASLLHLAQSNVMDKEILQNSLTSKAWSKLVRHSSLSLKLEFEEIGEFEEKQEDVKIFVKILHFMKREELSPFLMALLDLICESHPGNSVEIICPCRPEPHSISRDAFLLLEQVEGAFGTTEQSLKSIGFEYTPLCDNMLLATGSRMSRQKRETVTSIEWNCLFVYDKRSVEAFITLLQAKTVAMEVLDVSEAELGEEDWQALAGALRGKHEIRFNQVYISRQDLTNGMDSIKDIWDATTHGFDVFNTTGYQTVDKSEYDWEQAWMRLKQIADMTEEEWYAECQFEEGEESEEDNDGEDGDEEGG